MNTSILIGIALIVVFGTAAYFILRKRKTSETVEEVVEETTEDPVVTEPVETPKSPKETKNPKKTK